MWVLAGRFTVFASLASGALGSTTIVSGFAMTLDPKHLKPRLLETGMCTGREAHNEYTVTRQDGTGGGN